MDPNDRRRPAQALTLSWRDRWARARANEALRQALKNDADRIVIELVHVDAIDAAVVEFLIRARLHCAAEGRALTLRASGALAGADAARVLLEALDVDCRFTGYPGQDSNLRPTA